MAGVWILAENQEQIYELLNPGRDLATKLAVPLAVFVAADRDAARECIIRGADEILLLPELPDDQTLDAYIPVIVDLARQEDPDVFLLGGTLRGRDIAARIAARLGTGLCSQCTAVTYDEINRRLEMERLIFGGSAVQKVVCMTRPQMAAIMPRAFEPMAAGNDREGNIREITAVPASKAKVTDRRPKERESGNLTEARVVICAGRGIEKQEDMALLRQLADITGGEIGCTRPISEELHWLPEDTCIGLSGKQVKPELYIGLGISGQIQHITGIRDAKVICAVNSDENAPIFQVADYGITGDLYEVVPELIRQLQQASGK